MSEVVFGEIKNSIFLFQSFSELAYRPLLVDLTVEEGSRLKVIYGSADGFHAVDLDSASVYDIYLPKHVSSRIEQAIVKKAINYDFWIFFCPSHRLKALYRHTAS